jgi:hypothetical protein
MKGRIALLLLLIVSVIADPALAARKKQPHAKSATIHSPDCTGIDRKLTVAPDVAGYQKVTVHLEVPIPPGSNVEARGAYYSFSLFSLDPGFRYEKDSDAVLGIGQCTKDHVIKRSDTFFTGGTTWFRVRGTVSDSDDSSYTLETPILMPNRVVAAKPMARTTLKTGVTYFGSWEEGGTVLALRPHEE